MLIYVILFALGGMMNIKKYNVHIKPDKIF